MATKDFNASWADIYNASGGWSVAHHNHPIRTGGGSGTNWQTLIRIPDAVKTAIRESSTPAQLHMRIYFTSSANEIDIGHHRERNRRSVGSRGIPWYAYNETWRGLTNGWNSYQMSNWFMPQFLNGNVQGIVLYSANGRFNNTATGVGQTNSVRFRVTGTWNTAPSAPGNVRVDKSQVDISQTVRWNASTDAEGDSLVYQLEYYNGISWRRVSNAHGGTYYNFNTTNERYSNQAKFRVRAYDGELYSAWRESPEFGVEHVPPQITYGLIEYEDSNSATVAITGNNSQMIQNASIPKISVLDAFANDGKTIKRYIVSLDGQERASSTSGVFTFDPIKASSDQTLRVTVEDSAGLRSSTTRTIQVLPYELPKVQYSAQRVGSIDDMTTLSVSGSISSLNGRNSLQTTRYRYRQAGGSWTTWRTLNRSVSGNNFTASDVNLNLSNNLEWEIHIQVTDRVSTRDIYEDVGRGSPIMFIDENNDRLGVGKYPTRGSLDVDGEAYFIGDLFVNEVNISSAQRLSTYLSLSGTTASDTSTFWQNLPQGTYFTTPNNVPNQPSSYGVINHTTQAEGANSDFNTIWYTQPSGTIYRKSGNRNSNNDWTPIDLGTSGSNSQGHWIRFSDGTQICWGYYTGSATLTFTGSSRGVYGAEWGRSGSVNIDFPVSFTGYTPTVTTSRNASGASGINIFITLYEKGNDFFSVFYTGPTTATIHSGFAWMAMGRWY